MTSDRSRLLSPRGCPGALGPALPAPMLDPVSLSPASTPPIPRQHVIEQSNDSIPVGDRRLARTDALCRAERDTLPTI